MRGIVEDRDVIGFARGLSDEFLQRKVGKLRTGDQLVQGIDVPLMVFAIVVPERIGSDDGIQRIFGIG